MTFQQAPFLLGRNDELVEISSALIEGLPMLEVRSSFRNYCNKNVTLLVPAQGTPKANYSPVSMFQ